jgi:hypothetical protein
MYANYNSLVTHLVRQNGPKKSLCARAASFGGDDLSHTTIVTRFRSFVPTPLTRVASSDAPALDLPLGEIFGIGMPRFAPAESNAVI